MTITVDIARIWWRPYTAPIHRWTVCAFSQNHPLLRDLQDCSECANRVNFHKWLTGSCVYPTLFYVDYLETYSSRRSGPPTSALSTSGAKARRAWIVRVLDVIEGQDPVLRIVRLRKRNRDATANIASVLDNLARQSLDLRPVLPALRALQEGADASLPRLGAGDVEAVVVLPVVRCSVDILVKLEGNAVSRAEAASSTVDAQESFRRVGGSLLHGRGSGQENEN